MSIDTYVRDIVFLYIGLFLFAIFMGIVEIWIWLSIGVLLYLLSEWHSIK